MRPPDWEGSLEVPGAVLRGRRWDPRGGAGRAAAAASGAIRAPCDVVVVHGTGDHGGRYAGVADQLTALGCTVHAYDLRGNGAATGPRGHVDRFATYVADLHAVLGQAATGAGGKPVLLGHSVGGLVATVYAAQHPASVAGLALSSPFWGLDVPVPPLVRLLAPLVSALRPRASRNRPNLGKPLTHDLEVTFAYVRDPLVHFRISARLYMELRRTCRALPGLLPRITCPVLVMTGDRSPLVDPARIEAMFPLLGSRDKTLRLYPGFSHEVLHEKGRAAVFADLAGWLEALRG